MKPTLTDLPNRVDTPTPCIGVFDSGVGGLSVLAALRVRLPHVALCYIGDAAHAPYGERAPAEVIERCHHLVDQLARRGARLVVVACNTATVIGIRALRERWPDIAFVGVEPGVKPAVAVTRTRRIALMVTPATAASARLKMLIERHAAGVHVHVQACPGLAAAIELGPLDGPAIRQALALHCDAVQQADVDTVALGCTHYAWVAATVQQRLGEQVTLIDTAAAVANRAASLWPIDHEGEPRAALRIFSTGTTGPMQRLLEGCPPLRPCLVQPLTRQFDDGLG